MDGFLVEPQNQVRAGTTWEPSHEWWLAEATLSSRGFRWFTRKHWFPWLIHKTKTEEPKTEVQQLQTGLTGGSDRSNQWVWPVWPMGTGLTGEEHWSDRCTTTQSEDFEAEDTRRDRKACIEAKQVCGRWASVRWSDDKDRMHPRGACIPSSLVKVF
jgi:hypothetical protein